MRTMYDARERKVALDVFARISQLLLSNIIGAFKNVIHAHGQVSKNEIGSLAKRVHGNMVGLIRTGLVKELRRLRYDSFKAGYIQAVVDHGERWNAPDVNAKAAVHEAEIDTGFLTLDDE